MSNVKMDLMKIRNFANFVRGSVFHYILEFGLRSKCHYRSKNTFFFCRMIRFKSQFDIKYSSQTSLLAISKFGYLKNSHFWKNGKQNNNFIFEKSQTPVFFHEP